MNSPSFYVYAWIASILFALIAVIAKLTSKYSIANPWLFNFTWTLFSFLFTVPAAIIYGAGLPQSWPNILIASLLSGLVYIFYILVLYRLDISVLAPLFSLRTAASVILGFLLLGETLNTAQYLFVFLIITGGLFVSYDEKMKLRSFLQPAIGIALTLMLTLALMGIYMNKALNENSFWTVALWVNFLSLIPLLPTIPLFSKELGKVKPKQVGIVLMISFVSIIGTLASNVAYAVNVSITSAILSLPLSMVMAFMLSLIAPKLLEKHELKVYLIRFSAAAIMIYSALKLS